MLNSALKFTIINFLTDNLHVSVVLSTAHASAKADDVSKLLLLNNEALKHVDYLFKN